MIAASSELLPNFADLLQIWRTHLWNRIFRAKR